MRNLSNDLISIAIGAARAGTYPSDGRFYYVAYVDDDGQAAVAVMNGWQPEYQTLPDAIDRANDYQGMADTNGFTWRQFVVRTRDDGRIIYEPERTKCHRAASQ